MMGGDKEPRVKTLSCPECGATADPWYAAGGGGIVYICRDVCGFETGASPVSSLSLAAELWNQQVAHRSEQGAIERRRAQLRARQVLQDAQEAQVDADPLVQWERMATQGLSRMGNEKLTRTAAVAQAIALVRISRALEQETEYGDRSSEGAPEEVGGAGGGGVAQR